MDQSLEEMLNSYTGDETIESNNADSAVEETRVDNPSEDTTTVESDENGHEGAETQTDGTENNGGVVSDGEQNTESEAVNEEPRKSNNIQRKRPYSQLEKAEYSASKWKRRAKEMRDSRDAALAELAKYKDLNPDSFGDDERSRAKFLAWQASKEQQVNDMSDDIDAMESQYEQEIYEAKIADCYNAQGARDFEELDEHYGEAFKFHCSQVDPDNVIIDFLKGSRIEPYLREIIYKDGDLQEQLFATYRNPMIAANERLRLLREKEASVMAFLKSRTRLANAKQNVAPNKVASVRPTQNQQQTQNTNVMQGQNNQPTTRRFQLRSMANAQPTQNTQPKQNLARMATGSLVKGGNEPNGSLDTASAAAELMKEFMGR